MMMMMEHLCVPEQLSKTNTRTEVQCHVVASGIENEAAVALLKVNWFHVQVKPFKPKWTNSIAY